jgi:hypothetical protein
MVQPETAKSFENETTSPQIGIEFPSYALAVLSHGDFLPTVGRAWRGAQRIGQTCISTVLGDFRRLTARQGLSFCEASRTRGTQSAPGFQGWQKEQFQSTV